MTTLTWIKIAILAVLITVIATLSVLYAESRKHVVTLKAQVKEQSAIIDSLLSRRMTVFDVKLNVTDKSRNVVHGRYNKGTINMPQERTYKLEIDSVSVNVK
jgi:hypothetical protein